VITETSSNQESDAAVARIESSRSPAPCKTPSQPTNAWQWTDLATEDEVPRYHEVLGRQKVVSTAIILSTYFLVASPRLSSRSLNNSQDHMMIQLRRLTLALAIATCAFPVSPVQAVDVSVPSSPPNTTTAVKGNFLGVSFELSAFDKYCEFDPGYDSVVER